MTTLCFVDTETTGLDPDRHEIWEVAIILRDLDSDALRDALLEEASRPIGHTESAASYVPYMINAKDREYVWQLPVDLSRADLIALQIGQFHERRWNVAVGLENRRQAVRGDWPNLDVPGGLVKSRFGPEFMDEWAKTFVDLTWGATMIGMVPSFDTERLAKLVRKHGQCPGWHYQPVDVETIAAGYILGRAKGIALCAQSVPQANAIRERTGMDLPDIGQFRGALDLVDTARTLPWDSEVLSRAVGVDPEKYDRHSALGDCRWARDVWDAIHK